MSSGERQRRTRIATVLGISIAAGALLILAMLPAASSAVRLERQAVPASSDPTCGTGLFPSIPGYDPVTHEIYVPNEGLFGNTPNIEVFSGTCTIVGTISLPSGATPEQAVFDPSDNDMFVTDYALSQVYQISGLTIVATWNNTVLGGSYISEPFGITYAPSGVEDSTGYLWITSTGSDFLTGLLPELSDAFTFATEAPARYIAYDPADDYLWWTMPSIDAVSGLNYFGWTSLTVSTADTWSVGSNPAGLAFDLNDGLVYVADYGSDSVTVINAGPLGVGEIEGTISGFDGPADVAWDQANLHIYVTNYNSGKVYEVSGFSIVKKESTTSTSGASGICFDATNNKMYVAGYESAAVYVLS